MCDLLVFRYLTVTYLSLDARYRLVTYLSLDIYL